MEIAGAVIVAVVVPLVLLTIYLTISTAKTGAMTQSRALASGNDSLDAAATIFKQLVIHKIIVYEPAVAGSNYTRWEFGPTAYNNGLLLSPPLLFDIAALSPGGANALPAYDKAYVNVTPGAQLAVFNISTADSSIFLNAIAPGPFPTAGSNQMLNLFSSNTAPTAATGSQVQLTVINAFLTGATPANDWIEVQANFTNPVSTTTRQSRLLTQNIRVSLEGTVPYSCAIHVAQPNISLGNQQTVSIDVTTSNYVSLQFVDPYLPVGTTSTFASGTPASVSYSPTAPAGTSVTVTGLMTVAGAATQPCKSANYQVTNSPSPPSCHLQMSDMTWYPNVIQSSNGTDTVLYADAASNVSVSWTSTNATNCTVTGTSPGESWSGASSQIMLAPTIYDSRPYTLNCVGEVAPSCSAKITVIRYCWGAGGPLGVKFGETTRDSAQACYNNFNNNCPAVARWGAFWCFQPDYPRLNYPPWNFFPGGLCQCHPKEIKSPMYLNGGNGGFPAPVP